MYKVIRSLLVALCLLAAPLPLLGQQGSQPGDGRGHDRGMVFNDSDGPVRLLLRNRVVLSITSEQVARLEEIDRQLEERIRPFVAQLVQIRRQMPRGGRVREESMTPEQREAFHAQMRAAQPLFERIRENNHIAMKEVGKVLTEPQKLKLRELLIAERNGDGGGDPRRRSDDRRD